MVNTKQHEEGFALETRIAELEAERGRLRALLRRWYKTRGLHNEGSLLDDTESALEGE